MFLTRPMGTTVLCHAEDDIEVGGDDVNAETELTFVILGGLKAFEPHAADVFPTVHLVLLLSMS